jgi:hypothetical protein
VKTESGSIILRTDVGRVAVGRGCGATMNWDESIILDGDILTRRRIAFATGIPPAILRDESIGRPDLNLGPETLRGAVPGAPFSGDIISFFPSQDLADREAVLLSGERRKL